MSDKELNNDFTGELRGKSGYIDKNGNISIPLIFDKAYSFSENLAVIVINGKYGYIDQIGKEIIPCQFEYAASFKEGLAPVSFGCSWNSASEKTENEYHFIDIYRNVKKRVVFNNQWYVNSFKDGIAKVYRNDSEVSEIKSIYECYSNIDLSYEQLKTVGYIDENGIEYWAD